LAIYEGTQKVVAFADHHFFAAFERVNRFDPGFGNRAIYLHPVLND